MDSHFGQVLFTGQGSGAPPVPPRIDLGETEDTPTDKHDETLIKTSSNLNGSESSILPASKVTNRQHVAPSKPSPNLPVASTPNPSLAIKWNKPSKKQERNGRPEISIISARPMDQCNSVCPPNLKNENGLPMAQDSGCDNNNPCNKPSMTPRDSVSLSNPDNKRPSKPAPPPPKPTPYSKREVDSIKPANNMVAKKDTIPNRGKKSKSTKNESFGSVFYVDTSNDDPTKSEKDHVVASKAKRLPNETSTQPAVRPSTKTKPAVAPTPRKTKVKDELKAAQNESTTSDKQPEAKISKPKLKPTIITAKKPKQVANDVIVGEKTKTSASGNTAAPARKAISSSTKPVDTVPEATPPDRPNFPPNTVKEKQTEIAQPQRPKVPPNTIQESQKLLAKNKDAQKNLKNEHSTQRKPKSKPPRPPMAKESARIKPSRTAPAQPNIESKKKLSSSSNMQSDPKKQSNLSPENKPFNKSGPPHAIAKFDYSSETQDDLSFKAGDAIMLISRVDDDWFVGYLEGDVVHQGMFPSSFVDIIVDVKKQPQNNKIDKPLSSEPYAVTEHDFQGQSEGELSFSCGETVILIERINKEWLKGTINGTVGIFPENFVRIERDLPPATISKESVVPTNENNKVKTEKSGEEWCRAIHEFHGEHTDDLSFSVGNEIRITERIDQDWLRGVFGKEVGIFPASFVELIAKETTISKDFVFVTALHDYAGESSEDLSFYSGDKIRIIERINSDWLLGEINGKEGLFPASFVDGMPESLPGPLSKEDVEQPQATRLAKAIHDFSGEHPGELHFRVGDIIHVLREIDSSWCEGMINNVSGIFPTNFVEMEPLQPKGVCHAQALYDFDGESPQDLSFKAGDVIELLERINEDWWSGSFGGKTGQFPATFVEISASSS